MKKILTTLAAAMLVVLAGLSLSSCGLWNESALEVDIEDFNENVAPMSLGDGLTMTKAAMDEKAKEVIFYFTYDERDATMAEITPMLGMFGEGLVSGIKQAKPEERALFEEMTKAGYGMKCEFKGTKTGKTGSATVSVEKIKSALE